MMIPDLRSAVERLPLGGADGKSGALMERVVFPDGSALIVKTIDPSQDWIMQATDDPGRIVDLAAQGVFEQMPSGVDSAMIGAERLERGLRVYMPDVSHAVFPDGVVVSREQGRRLLAGAASMHRRFQGESIEGLFDLAGLYRFLSPASARAMTTDEPIPGLILDGWDRLHELLPADVSDAVRAVHDAPASLASAFDDAPHTLVHGDFKLANLAMDDDQVYFLDWGALTSWAPPAVEMAYFIAVNSAAVDATLDELLDDVRATNAAGPEDPVLPLALFGALVQLGWDKGLAASSADEATRTREVAALDWWIARSREALQLWSPPSTG